MAEYNLSFDDLYKVSGFAEAVAAASTGNDVPIKDILFMNGVDVTQPVTYASNTHRTLTGKQYTGIRVEGSERTDPEWIASGCASMEAKIEAGTDDITLRQVLRRMKYEGISDKVIRNL